MRHLMLAAVLAAGPSLASAETVHLTAPLSAAKENPPVESPATGTADMTLNTVTHELAYTITFEGLSGPVSVAHIFGPGEPGADAPVLLGFPSPFTSPMQATITLYTAQVADVLAGRTYINLHTAAHRGGELRGQIEVAK